MTIENDVVRAVTRELERLPYTRMKARQEQVDFVVISEATADIMQTLPFTRTPQEPSAVAVCTTLHRRLQEHGVDIDPRDLPKSPHGTLTVGDLSKPSEQR